MAGKAFLKKPAKPLALAGLAVMLAGCAVATTAEPPPPPSLPKPPSPAAKPSLNAEADDLLLGMERTDRLFMQLGRLSQSRSDDEVVRTLGALLQGAYGQNQKNIRALGSRYGVKFAPALPLEDQRLIARARTLSGRNFSLAFLTIVRTRTLPPYKSALEKIAEKSDIPALSDVARDQLRANENYGAQAKELLVSLK